jgi:outer membrane immunogenic protein
MKKLLLASATLAAVAAFNPAGAADMALKAPPPVVVTCDWCGFYVGLNAGYSFGHSSNNTTATGTPAVPALFSAGNRLDGALGGGQIGYNWESASKWVFGLEADIQGTGQRGSATLPTIITGGFPFAPGDIITGNYSEKLPWFGTARARLGYAPSATWMLYVTGGLAYGEINTTANLSVTTNVPGPGLVTNAAGASANNTRAGWTVGAGSEWMIGSQWSAKVEYLYMDFGTFTDTFVGAGFVPTFSVSSHVTDNIVRVGLNYHFK